MHSRWELREVARDQGVKAEDTIQVVDDPDGVQHKSHQVRDEGNSSL